MRHGKKFNHLGRKVGHRKALLQNLACALIEHKRINTTLAKAKELRRVVEPILTRSKTDNTHNRREVFSKLSNKEAVKELFREIAPKIADRPGGYVRIIKTGFRQGDNAEMAMIELVDFNELYTNAKAADSAKKTRRRGGKKSSSASPETAPATPVIEDVAVEEIETPEETAETADVETTEATEKVDTTKEENIEPTNEEKTDDSEEESNEEEKKD